MELIPFFWDKNKNHRLKQSFLTFKALSSVVVSSSCSESPSGKSYNCTPYLSISLNNCFFKAINSLLSRVSALAITGIILTLC
jgi:hypothetical protein